MKEGAAASAAERSGRCGLSNMAHCALGQGSFRALVGAGRERPERGPRAEVIFGRSFAVKESGIMNIRGCETKRVFCFVLMVKITA